MVRAFFAYRLLCSTKAHRGGDIIAQSMSSTSWRDHGCTRALREGGGCHTPRKLCGHMFRGRPIYLFFRLHTYPFTAVHDVELMR